MEQLQILRFLEPLCRGYNTFAITLEWVAKYAALPMLRENLGQNCLGGDIHKSNSASPGHIPRGQR